MSLTSSMYAGITGLSAHGEKMSVIGNNLANVNTMGFKGARMRFEDVMSQDVYTTAGVGQVGRGVRIASIYTDYSQGSFESTNESTDLAIGGEGFFIVSPKGEGSSYYTRAGNFRFDNDGYLVDPNGYVVQGWQVEQTSTSAISDNSATSTTTTTRIIGSPTDIRLENFQSPPSPTTRVSMITNLDPSTASRANRADAPYFALMDKWDGTANTPMAQDNYAYSSTLKVYDAVGTAHDMTVYFDQVTMSNAGGDTVWEYVVTVDPDEDGRVLGSTSMNQTSAAGLLMTGTLTFRTGNLIGMSAFTLQSDGGGNVKGLQHWKPAEFSTAGYPVLTANFLGQSGASVTAGASAVNIEMNFGIRNTDLASNGSGIVGWSTQFGGMPSNAAMVGTNITQSGTLPNFRNPEVSALATQSFDTGGSSTLFQGQDGYGAGFLQNVTVSRDGVLTGRYSNGQVLELYALTLATFTNQWGLRRDGSNLFVETRDSGPALTGQANTGSKGTVASNSLESSNVDMATEFVDMIVTQRGFQANTKVITTTDSLLGEVIAMKR